MTTSSLLYSLLLLLAQAFAAQAEKAPLDVFTQLKSLVGTWEGKRPDGSSVSVVYRLTAAGSVLIETWTLSPMRESLTLYHMDEQALVATHYCPIGNQPTLQLKSVSGSHFSFEFRSATNLPDRKAAHQHWFEIELLRKDRYRRKETYLNNGETGTDDMTFSRVN